MKKRVLNSTKCPKCPKCKSKDIKPYRNKYCCYNCGNYFESK